MNLRQFRVFGAVLRLPAQFTTPDLVREAGVSAEVVRKTYQRFEPFFAVVSDTKPKVRSLTPTGREEITRELRQSRSLLPPPPASRGPEGEPLGLAAAEHILYQLVPAADAEGRTLLLREARSHLELADQECELSDEPGPSIPVEVRLDAVRRMLGLVELLHSAQDVLTRRVPKTDFSSVGALAAALINSAAAQEFSQRPTPTPVCAGLLTLKGIRARTPEEADQIARALRGLAREPAWCKALGHPGVFWTSDEEAILEARLKDSTAILEPRTREPFTIAVDRWEEAEHSPASERTTAALLRIAVKDKVATRHLDPWSGSLHDSARLDAHSLALWLARSWWRLRWEPAPWGTPGPSWRRAHAVSTIGHGWPSLSLESNGERIYGRCRPPRKRGQHDPWYLETFDESVLAKDFERTVDRFIDQVLGHLAGSGQAELAVVWRRITAERADPALSKCRRLEAMLGFNPDEAPEQVVQDLNDLSTEAGPSAVDELAWACAGRHPAVMLTKTAEIARSSKGIEGWIVVPQSVLESSNQRTGNELPWARGHRLARACREYVGFGRSPVSDAELAETLSLAATEMSDDAPAPAQSTELSLAIRNPDKRHDKFLFHTSRRYTRRFEAARFLADAFLAHPDDRWLLGTRAGTARQQAQRAFANEFLAPIDSLREFLGGDRSDEHLEEAAVHFGLTSNAVRRHLDLNAMEFA